MSKKKSKHDSWQKSGADWIGEALERCMKGYMPDWIFFRGSRYNLTTVGGRKRLLRDYNKAGLDISKTEAQSEQEEE